MTDPIADMLSQIRNALAVYFKTGTSNVKIISGHTSRNKIIDIMF